MSIYSDFLFAGERVRAIELSIAQLRLVMMGEALEERLSELRPQLHMWRADLENLRAKVLAEIAASPDIPRFKW